MVSIPPNAKETRPRSEVITCNAVISACGKAGRWQMAWEVLQAAGTRAKANGEHMGYEICIADISLIIFNI